MADELETLTPTEVTPTEQQGGTAPDAAAAPATEAQAEPELNEQYIADLAGKLASKESGAGDKLSGIINDLTERMAAGDVDAPRLLKYTEDQLGAIASGTAKPKADEQKPSEKTPPPAAPDAAKPTGEKFAYTYKGKRYEAEDQKGLIGFETTGHLKRAYLQQQQRLRELEAQRGTEYSELASTKARIAELESKIAAGAPSPAARPQPQSQPSAQPQAPVQKVDRPAPPQYPKLSTDDPLEYTVEDRRSVTEYNNSMNKYLADNAKYQEYLETVATRGAVPESITSEIAQLRDKLANAEAKLSSVDANEQRRSEEREIESRWNSFSDLQGQVEHLKTPEPIRQTHEKVMGWMDEIAALNGVNKPMIPENTTDPNGIAAINSYRAARGAIARKYLDGDQTVVANSESAPPPAGYQAYFKVAEINAFRENLVREGKLGPKSTLYQAYREMLDETGQIDDGMTQIRIEERTKAANTMGEALERSQIPSPLPDRHSAEPEVPSNKAGISDEDAIWVVQASKRYDQIQKSPKDLARYNAITAKLQTATSLANAV